MHQLKINETIRAKRRARDLTQEELANLLGVTKAAVSKWENAESYPDITMLTQIAQIFHITMDELFGYTLDVKPPRIIQEFHAGFALSDLENHAILDHGIIRESGLEKCQCRGGDARESTWEVRVHMISQEDDFPYTLQKCIKPERLLDLYSYRLADGKMIDDDKPNKHYVCREKVWEYHTADHAYLKEMLREQRAMGLIEDDE